MIYRTRKGGPPSGGPEPGNTVTQVGDLYIEHDGAVPDQAEIDAHLQPAGSTHQQLADAIEFQDKVFKGFALTVLDEINLLRVNAGLSSRTLRQLKNAIKAKMDSL